MASPRRQEYCDIYWEQAKNFYSASHGLPMQSSPLLLYYSFMNAAKALLEAKSATYVAHHGVTEATPHGPVRRKMSLSNLKVKIKQSGIVPSLSAYYREAETVRTHAMDDLFYNLPFIHRTFCLTYASLTDMFLPIKEDEFVRKKATGEIFFRAKFVSDISVRSVRNKLPQSVEMDPDCPNGIRSKARVIWAHATKPNAVELAGLEDLHQVLRADLHYINGSQTLWYLKTTGKRRLARRSPTIVLEPDPKGCCARAGCMIPEIPKSRRMIRNVD